jgi:hypothetical protein
MKPPKQSPFVGRDVSESLSAGERAAYAHVTLSSGGGGGSNPPPGCYPNGTKCRGWMQSMVYCCPGGQTWEKSEGWCVGWWDALPCR